MTRPVQIDHLLVRVRDLEEAAVAFGARGLPSIPGGRHPGWGTANRIVPLGDAYLELVAVVDEHEADGSAFGRWAASAEPGRMMGWAVRPDDLEAAAARLGLEIAAGSRMRPDGTELRWRVAGIEVAATRPSLPFFIEWAPRMVLPGRAAPPVGRLQRLDVTVAPDTLGAWLGDLPREVRVTDDSDHPTLSVVVALADGRTVDI